jgi:iron complex transport system ATP-binding protein
LLDEPCAGLDPAARRHFLETLRGLARHGTTLLLVTHHIEEILPEIDRVVLLQQGHLFAEGDKQELLNGHALSQLFGMDVSVDRRDGYYTAQL